MKKKLFVILLSLVMVATMMPLSAFAGTQNAQVRTDLGNTGLYLLGNRPALPGDDQDYVVNEKENWVKLRTDGWTIGGKNKDFDIDLYREGRGEFFNINLEDGLSVEGIQNEDGGIQCNLDGNVTIEEYFFADGANFTGAGSLEIIDGSLVSGGGEMNGNLIEMDGPTIKINTENKMGAPLSLWCAGDFDFKSGKLIINNNQQGVEEEAAAIVCDGQVNMGENAELFVNSNGTPMAVKSPSSLLEKGLKGDAEKKTYEERETVQSNLATAEVEIFGEKFQGFVIDGTNATFAKTLYCSTGEEPTTTHKVTFMVDDTEYTSQEVADGYCAKMPIDPVEDGYKFTGWYYDKEATEIFDFDTPITSDLTLYAGWEKAAPTPDNPQSGGNAKTGDNTMPIAFIALGFAAAVTGYVAYRKLRNR